MIRVVRTRTQNQLEQAVLMLRDQLATADPTMIRNSPAFGCCGCNAWMADVVTPSRPDLPHGEGYCWGCVGRLGITDYEVLTSR